jgi:hypothetical protein
MLKIGELLALLDPMMSYIHLEVEDEYTKDTTIYTSTQACINGAYQLPVIRWYMKNDVLYIQTSSRSYES